MDNIFQVNTDVNVDTKHQTMAGVAFPIRQDAIDKLRELKDGALNYVQLVSSVTFACGFSWH